MVTVENIRTIENTGNLKALAVVNIGGKVRVRDVKVVQQPNAEAWVAMPSKSYEVNGQRKWSNTVEILDEALKAEISEAVLKEYAKLDRQPAEAQEIPW